ncbi:hypothetical protein J4439_07265 [Candidatus Woesearchaeota archaeon]|nr:hypothetical protein [Candidatus Woesearchaeota archaeon]
MKQTTIVIVVLALLIVLSGVQAVQLTSLKGQLAEAKLTAGSGSSRVKVASAPSSLDELPQMVGGC